MNAVVVMFDSLNRGILEPYQATAWSDVNTPNFVRLASRSCTFDTSYVGSMPCMPARRELHTSRLNFLHRSWGPLEPFDDSMPQMLKEAGVYTALVSDHQHYWEDGGATYHGRYSVWQHFRGQEGDAWMGQVAYEPPGQQAIGRNAVEPPNLADAPLEYQDRINRRFIQSSEDFPQQRTFEAGIDFIERNADEDRWFLQIETFDPHEPFYAAPEFADQETQGRVRDWPEYRRLRPDDSPEDVAWYRRRYAELVRQCDASLGRVLDAFDRHGLWDNTILIVATDHGFLLGEHDCYAKLHTPWWDEIARTPFFVWDPRHAGSAGQRRRGLVQPMLEIPVTLLKAFGVEPTRDMVGGDLAGVLERDRDLRQVGLFGNWGGHVNATDGRYVYMRAPASADNQPLCEYTLMPTHMRQRFEPSELTPDRCRAHPPLSFTKGAVVLKIDAVAGYGGLACEDHPASMLYDTSVDPLQEHPIEDRNVEARMIRLLKQALRDHGAPDEQFIRLGLNSAP